jgi:hypothetical protein
MSASKPELGAPIARGSPLARALDEFAVPQLAPDFADRVLAASARRAAPLPALRQVGAGRARGWWLGRRLVIGIAGFSALASAAAATGLLERVGLPLPSGGKVWASITGKNSPARAAMVAPPALPLAAPAPAPPAPAGSEGVIDTPEQLDEVFRRIDEARQRRSAARSALLDERLARAIERRRAAGLPPPTPEQEARIRQHIEEARARREALISERIAARRAELRERVEKGEALRREDLVRPLREEQREVIERLRQMPPEQRRALLDAWRARRAARPGGEPAPGLAPPAEAPPASPSPAPAPETVGEPQA